MAAPKFSDGDRPIDGVLNNPIAPSDWNDMMDEVKGVFGEQYVPAVMSVGFSEFRDGPATPGWEVVVTDPPHLFNNTGTAKVMYLVIPVRAGGTITEVRGLINGVSTGGATGSIKIRRAKRAIIGGPAADTLVSIALSGGASPDFDLASTLTLFAHVIDTGGGATELVKEDHIYYFEIIAPDGGGGNEAFVYQLGVMYALGPVTGAT